MYVRSPLIFRVKLFEVAEEMNWSCLLDPSCRGGRKPKTLSYEDRKKGGKTVKKIRKTKICNLENFSNKDFGKRHEFENGIGKSS